MRMMITAEGGGTELTFKFDLELLGEKLLYRNDLKCIY